ncbi:thioredoxin family protein [Flavobacterium sp. RHBU_24]|uniref:thioredoxin family protein n=1 Tax=Flavobacterium sp. RHBU_24 TaxID=3391185 RepID=UPI00398540CD
MSSTATSLLPLGSKAPHLWLPDTNSNNNYSFNQLKGKVGTVVIFLGNSCPFTAHVLPEVVKMNNDYRVMGIEFAGINSNDAGRSPQDGPANMTEFAFNQHMDFPYLYDETQDVAKAFDATCTPDFYLFDNEDTLVYHGQLDDSRPGNGIALGGADLRTAIDSLLYNRTIPEVQKPSTGCYIIWQADTNV